MSLDFINWVFGRNQQKNPTPPDILAPLASPNPAITGINSPENRRLRNQNIQQGLTLTPGINQNSPMGPNLPSPVAPTIGLTQEQLNNAHRQIDNHVDNTYAAANKPMGPNLPSPVKAPSIGSSQSPGYSQSSSPLGPNLPENNLDYEYYKYQDEMGRELWGSRPKGSEGMMAGQYGNILPQYQNAGTGINPNTVNPQLQNSSSTSNAGSGLSDFFSSLFGGNKQSSQNNGNGAFIPEGEQIKVNSNYNNDGQGFQNSDVTNPDSLGFQGNSFIDKDSLVGGLINFFK